MSEMLANYYFQQREYLQASNLLEEELSLSPDNKKVKKKLIIAYTQVGQVNKALTLLVSLIKEDIRFITCTDHYKEDCPCPDLIYDYENNRIYLEDDYRHLLTLGILWLYCDIYRSLNYLAEAEEKKTSPLLSEAIEIILKEIESINKT